MTRNSTSMIAHEYREGMVVVCMYDHLMHDRLNYLNRYTVLSVGTDEAGSNYLEVTTLSGRKEKCLQEWFVPEWYYEGKEDPMSKQAQQFENVPDLFPIAEQEKLPAVGQKWDTGKTNPALLYEGVPLALALVTRTLDYGFAKYKDAHGWSRVPNAIVRYTSAGYRHWVKFLTGETHDEESGLLHEAHECINKLFVLELKLRQMSKMELAAEMIHKEPPHG